MLLAYNLDWLSFTDPDLLPQSKIFNEEWAQPVEKKLTPMRGYDRALKLEVGRVDWHSKLMSQRRLWTFTGSDLQALRDAGYKDENLIDDILGVHDGHLTRLDFAIDVRESGGSPSDIEQAWRTGDVHTSSRKMTVIETDKRGYGGLGKTVYIGSRQSQMMLRVYDKAAETGEGEDWVRIEAEMKQPFSRRVAGEMKRIGIAPAGTAAIKRFASAPSVGWYSDALSGAGEVDLRGARKQTDWEKWVLSVALPNVIKAIKEGVPDVQAEITRAIQDIDKT